MDDQHIESLGREQVVDLPGVGGHFNHQRVAGLDLALDPALEILRLNAARAVDDGLLAIDRHRNHEVLVDIQPKVTFGFRQSGL